MAMLFIESKSNLLPFGEDNLEVAKQLGVNLQDFSHPARELAQLNMIRVKYRVHTARVY